MTYFMKAFRIDRVLVAASATTFTSICIKSHWFDNSPFQNNIGCYCAADQDSERKKILIRKRSTLRKANTTVVENNYEKQHQQPQQQQIRLQRRSTRDELAIIRVKHDEFLKRWELDEDGWRDLPARAWPSYQPNEEELVGIQEQVKLNGCTKDDKSEMSELCQTLLFQEATSLVFYNINPDLGLQQFEELAVKYNHVDSMVACGIILVEGFGNVTNREEEGVNWLKKAVTLNSIQGMYELGTVYYTGIDGVINEDSTIAFNLFTQAASNGQHVGAMYMTADCLIDGEGTTKNIAKAIPLLYHAADNGHRFARQRIRELLQMKEYQ